MKSLWLAIAIGLLSFAGSACTYPTVQAIHAPFHPASSDTITLSADAQASQGLVEISIHRRSWDYSGYCGAWVAGKCVPLPTLSDQIVKTCTFDGHPSTSQHCEATIGPFPDGKFIAYGAQALDAKGQTGVDQWIGFAVGAQKDPDEPIAVYTRGSSDHAIDVVLIPVDYNGTPGRTERDFAAAARNLIVTGYLQNPRVTSQRYKWNLYINPRTGGLMTSIIGRKVSQSTTAPTNWSHISPLADTVGYVHNNATWRDFANFADGGIGQFTINASLPGTIMHETGHAIFGLSDEYCCDGGIITTSWPHPNMFDDQATCQTSATDHGIPTGNCTQITTTAGFCGGTDPVTGAAIIGGTNDKWRQDIFNDLMGCGGNSGVDGGALDVLRINWFYGYL